MVDNIPNFPGYHIDNTGKVFNRKLRGSNKNTMSDSYKELKATINRRDGYPYVRLWDGKGNKKAFKVSRLVGLVYIPNPHNKPCVCHKDDIRTNSYYENLYWGTYLENNMQCINSGRGNKCSGERNHFFNKKGENHPASKLLDSERLEAKNLSEQGFSQKYISEHLGCSQGAISRIIKKFKTKQSEDICKLL